MFADGSFGIDFEELEAFKNLDHLPCSTPFSGLYIFCKVKNLYSRVKILGNKLVRLYEIFQHFPESIA